MTSYLVEVELSFPPDQATGESTHLLQSVKPTSKPVAKRVQRYFSSKEVKSVVRKLDDEHH